MKKLLIIIIGCIIGVHNVYAQEATVVGTVSDAKTGETIIGANVFIPDSETGTMSDFDGNYKLECPAGEVKLRFSFISYEAQEILLELAPGETRKIDVELLEAVTTLQQVEVQAKANRENENLLLMEQKKAVRIQESIGASEMSKKAVSDAAGGVSKVCGISMQGARKLFVRGLGDRYNRTEINGIAMASPNPDQRLLPLDLFPLDVVSTLDVRKIFSAADYADYSGALINIRTKDYPEKAFLKFKAGTSVNSRTSFQDFRLADAPDDTHIGFNLDERMESMPEALTGVNEISQRYYFPNEPFSTGYDYSTLTALPNMDVGISGGKTWSLKNGHTLGTVFTSSFSKGKSFYQGRDVVLKADGTILKSFDYDEYAATSSFSNLAGLTWRHNDNQITYHLIYLNNTEDKLIDKQGVDAEDYHLFVRTMVYHDHRLFSNQLTGQHKIGDKISINWDAAYSAGKSAEPDRRVVVFERNQETNQADDSWYYYSLFTLNQGETLRYFSEMKDSTLAASARMTYDFNEKPGDHIHKKLEFGMQGMQKKRDFASHVFFYNLDQCADQPAGVSQPGDDVVFPDPTNIDVTNVINDAAFSDSSIFIKNNTQNRDSYDAGLDILASYLELTYSLNPALLLNAGLRAEISEQYVNYFDRRERQGRIAGIDLFPALSLKYEINDKSNLRMALSKTLTRAGFLEMAPFRYRPSYGSATTFGNAGLQHADNYNADLKWEIFPKPGEIFSLAAYGKILKTPIERVSQNQGGGIEYTYQNAESGQVFGLEAEFRKNIFSELQAGMNASWIYTEVKTSPETSNTFKTHAMQGASPYLLNADLLYRLVKSDNVNIDASVMYNLRGKRIYAVGDAGKGDIYELPFNSLDALVRIRMYEGWELSLTAKNLLNEEKIFEQDIVTADNTGTYEKNGSAEVNRYKTGVWFKIGVSYKLRNKK
ncbi:MAG: TonB-dependent receptor domain-containing protein [Bacteroidota bacterium]